MRERGGLLVTEHASIFLPVIRICIFSKEDANNIAYMDHVASKTHKAMEPIGIAFQPLYQMLL